jgi:hypothetical protein
MRGFATVIGLAMGAAVLAMLVAFVARSALGSTQPEAAFEPARAAMELTSSPAPAATSTDSAPSIPTPTAPTTSEPTPTAPPTSVSTPAA